MSAVDEWMSRARGDLKLAELAVNAELYDGAAFHLQQALEKALKGLLSKAGRRPTRTHDLEHLARQGDACIAPFSLEELTHISQWVVSGRYPSEQDVPPTREELVAVAGRIRSWFEQLP